MRHLIFRGFFLKAILTVAPALAFACLPAAFGQRGGAHVGGAGPFPSGGRVAVPRAPAAPRPVQVPAQPRPVAPRPVTMPPPPRPVTPWHPAPISPPPNPRRLGQPPAAGFGTPGFHPHMIPPKRLPLPRRTVIAPVTPIPSYPVIFGQPPFYFGPGAGFNALWWQGCGPFSLWYWTCNTAPFYGYGFGNYLSGSSSPYENYEPQPYEVPAYQPLYLYSGGPRELVELYLKDGTVYDVTDYWLVNGELHFTTTEGDKSVEHSIPFDDLDLQKTVDVNTQRGFHFMLRNEPIEQYIQDHPDAGSSMSPTAPSLGVPQTSPSPGAPAAPPQTQPPPGTLQPAPAEP